MVLRFGKFIAPEVQPGLNYHLPYPIETVLTPPALRVNKTDIGRAPEDFTRRAGTRPRELPEESLMLTGDENIVDVEFSVLWRIKPGSVGDYLFNVQNPEGTVKAVAESAMREVIGRSNIQRLLTWQSQLSGPQKNIESEVQDQVQKVMQKTLDMYRAGILIQSVQVQSINPPAEVNDSFLDVQAARIGFERAQNEAQTYANRVVPEARGRAAKIIQDAEAYREQTVAEAKGETSRFLQIYEQYKKAPDCHPRAHVSGNDGTHPQRYQQDDHRYRPRRPGRGALSAAHRAASAAEPQQHAANRHFIDGSRAMRIGLAGGVIAVLVIIAIIVGYGTLFTVSQTQQALVVRLGKPVRVITDPGLNVKVPFIDSVIYVDKRILDIELPAQEISFPARTIRPPAASAKTRRRRLRPLPHHRSAEILSDGRRVGRRCSLSRPAQLGAAAACSVRRH